MDQLRDHVSRINDRYSALNASLKKKEARMRELKDLLRLAGDYARLKPVADGIPPKGGFGKKREKYMAEHDSEIRQYYAVRRKLESALPDKKLMLTEWQAELDRLGQKYAAGQGEARALWDELKKLRDIRYKADTVLHDQDQHLKTIEHER